MKAQQAIAVVKEITAIAPRLVKGLQKGRRSMGFQGIFYANYLQLTVLSWKTQEPCLT